MDVTQFVRRTHQFCVGSRPWSPEQRRRARLEPTKTQRSDAAGCLASYIRETTSTSHLALRCPRGRR